MPKYDAVVIGAGNGGLAAACRLAKAGKKTLLVEQHNLPGGVASSFRRGRFEFETALHELCEFGSAENPGNCRTTVVDELHEVSDFEKIGALIPGAKRYFLQAFTDRDTVPFEGFHAPSKEKLDSYLAAVSPFVPSAELRGV